MLADFEEAHAVMPTIERFLLDDLDGEHAFTEQTEAVQCPVQRKISSQVFQGAPEILLA